MTLLRGLIVALAAVCPRFALAMPSATPACNVTFQIVILDRLNNYDVGIPDKSLKDIEKRLSKYGDVCYAGAKQGDLVFFVHTTPATYHGTHVYMNNSSSAAAVSDGNGGGAAAAATSTSTTAVPYDVDYSVFILDVEVPQPDNKFKVVRTFDQKGIYRIIYGIGYGKGKHPIPNVIDAAAGWVHDNLAVVMTDLTSAKTRGAAPAPGVQTAPMSSLTVESSIPGADIEIDGLFVGSTPATVDVASGRHLIVVKKKGYAEWNRSMMVSGVTAHLNADLDASSSLVPNPPK